MTIARTLLLMLLSLFAWQSAAAQNSGSIKGQLKDSSGKQVLSLATVTVFIAKDTSIITYRLSDATGNFKIPGLPLNVDSRVLVSFSGYRTFRKDFLLTKEAPALDLGLIKLNTDANNLEEVTVFAERPPVSVRKDTIEFNASAFKTLPSALLEDLLKKLPGLEIDPNGDIMVKGKKVNRLLVDGKEFFGGDPQIATKNLPANIVDKVQVMNDKEQMDKDPETPESEIGQVINIKLKKSIKQGWFGKAYAGGGTDNRHELGAFLNAFRDTTQISILGYTNNINKAGFGINDVMKIGGFNRSGANSIMIMSDGGFAINDVSFGGTGQGLQKSSGGGFNFNDQYGKKITLNLQYFYGQINSEYSTKSNQQRFFRDTTLTTLSRSDPFSVSMNHRIGGTVTWKADSLTTITFRPGITLNNNRSSAVSGTMTSDNFRGRVNGSSVNTNGKGNNTNYNTNIFLSRLFKKKGRSFSANMDFSNSDIKNDYYTNGIYTTYNGALPDDSLVNQLRRTIGENLRASANLSFAEPINKDITLRITHNISFIKDNNGISFLSRDNISGKYDAYNQDFSNSIHREGWRNTTSASMSIKVKKFLFRPGVNYLNATFDNDFTKNPSITQKFNFITPSMSINWGPLSLSYNANIQEPDATNLQQIIDVSNRFYQQFGNPNLQPTYSHTINLSGSKYDAKTGNSFSTYISGGFINNAVIRQTTIDRDGIQTTRPVNVDGTYRFNGSINYSYQYKFNKNFKLSMRPGIFGNFGKSIISVNQLRSGQNNFSLSPTLSLGMNYMDKIKLNQRYSQSYRQTTYPTNSTYRNIYVLTHSLESEVVVRLPKHFVWENLVNYYYNPQVAAGIRKSNVRWNAGINYLFLKEDKAQIKFSVFDLLNQNINVFRSTGENYLIDTENSTLTRYYMLAFTYNLRNFTGGKVGGKDRSMFFF